jgi:SAM-dependent methyltransferase
MKCICNITGKEYIIEDINKHKGRERGFIYHYTNRNRACAYVLSKMLFNEVIILRDIPENKNIKGIGMSETCWISELEEKLSFINTYYDKEPFLDMYNENHIKNYCNLDFIISTDVFEHISPYPNLQIAFDNLYKMLKPNGFIVFSVPYQKNFHVEWFPNLCNYRIVKSDYKYALKKHYLINTRIDGVKEVYKNNVVFHNNTDGKATSLEMRVFSKKSIEEYLKNSGFTELMFYEITEDMNKYGIYWDSEEVCEGHIISAVKR